MSKDFVSAEQAAEFVGGFFRGVGIGQYGRERVQRWIEDPNRVAKIQAFLDNDMRLEVVGGITIDRDRPLVLPEKWEIRDEDQIVTRATGTFVSGPGTTIRTYLDEGQTTGQCYMNGMVLQPIITKKELVVERATTFEQYAANHLSVPEEMKDGRAYIAWGDIVRGAGGSLRVRCFIWRDGQPRLRWDFVDDSFRASGPALLASQTSGS